MFSNRKCAGGGKNSERESENQAFTFNFLVHGSSVPIHSQQPKTLRECRNCKDVRKTSKRKELSFPVDKIIYLSERLELMSMTEKKINTISLSAEDADFQESEPVHQSERNEIKYQERVSTPGFDFSLDLSCVSNTGDESDENCEPSEIETFPHYNSESSSTIGSGKETPQGSNCAAQNHIRFSLEKPTISDSVKVYVNTVDKQKDLMKFFRPCHSCNESCCVCSSPSSRSFENPRERYGEACCFEGTGSDPLFACECTIPKKDSCCREILETDFFSPLCGEECGCRSDSAGSDRILDYTSSLASAARSARVLARDLEFILSTLNNETDGRR